MKRTTRLHPGLTLSQICPSCCPWPEQIFSLFKHICTSITTSIFVWKVFRCKRGVIMISKGKCVQSLSTSSHTLKELKQSWGAERLPRWPLCCVDQCEAGKPVADQWGAGEVSKQPIESQSCLHRQINGDRPCYYISSLLLRYYSRLIVNDRHTLSEN